MEFLKNTSEKFELIKRPIELMHSEENRAEKAPKVILGAEFRTVTRVYTSNWVLPSSRYDVLLGMPWHVANNPKIENSKMDCKG